MSDASNPAAELSEAERAIVLDPCVGRVVAARLAAGGAAGDEGLRARVEALCDEFGKASLGTDFFGNTLSGWVPVAHLRAALLNPPMDLSDAAPAPTEDAHEHTWKRRQNVTTRGYVMPAYEACDACGAARAADTAAEEPRTEALLPARRFAEAQAVTARARGSEAERDWLDLLHLLDRADRLSRADDVTPESAVDDGSEEK